MAQHAVVFCQVPSSPPQVYPHSFYTPLQHDQFYLTPDMTFHLILSSPLPVLIRKCSNHPPASKDIASHPPHHHLGAPHLPQFRSSNKWVPTLPFYSNSGGWSNPGEKWAGNNSGVYQAAISRPLSDTIHVSGGGWRVAGGPIVWLDTALVLIKDICLYLVWTARSGADYTDFFERPACAPAWVSVCLCVRECISENVWTSRSYSNFDLIYSDLLILWKISTIHN